MVAGTSVALAVGFGSVAGMAVSSAPVTGTTAGWQAASTSTLTIKMPKKKFVLLRDFLFMVIDSFLIWFFTWS